MSATVPSDSVPASSLYPPSLHWDLALPPRPVYAFLDAAAAGHPSQAALDFMGRRTTYADLKDQVDRAAAGLQRLGVTRGTRVGLCLPNTPFTVIAYYAVLKAGGTVVNFNPLYTAEELAKQVRDSGTRLMITIDLVQIYPKLHPILDQGDLDRIVVGQMRDCLPSLKGVLFGTLKRSQIARVVYDDRHTPFADLTNEPPIAAPPAIDPERDIAVLQYTGGTTGIPKGAMLTHANLSANTQQLIAWMPDVAMGSETVYGVLPCFHVLAMTVVLNLGIAIGSEIVLATRFELQDALKTITRKKPTLFPGVPTIYTALKDAPDLQRYDLSSLKYCISGGAPLPLEVKREFEDLTGCTLVEGYGLTEASPVVACNPLTGEARTGSIGIPLPQTTVSMRSISDTQTPVEMGERGELCLKGPQVMQGYWNRPDETANVMVDGWLRTGDVGYMDADGYIYLTDRIKDVILCGGFNVYPRVIEEAIYEHPAVAEVAVVGIPDAYRGQSPKAFIRLREHGDLDETGLRAFLAEKISKIEMPTAFEFREELPKTSVGKLSKKTLQDEEAARASAGGAAADLDGSGTPAQAPADTPEANARA